MRRRTEQQPIRLTAQRRRDIDTGGIVDTRILHARLDTVEHRDNGRDSDGQSVRSSVRQQNRDHSHRHRIDRAAAHVCGSQRTG